MTECRHPNTAPPAPRCRATDAYHFSSRGLLRVANLALRLRNVSKVVAFCISATKVQSPQKLFIKIFDNYEKKR
jgi:hypothetical protein